MAFVKMTVAVAATALALLAPAAHAEPQDVLRTANDGVVEALEQDVAMATSFDWDSEPELNTTYTNKLVLDFNYVMTVSSYYSNDRRTSNSYYVCESEYQSLYVTVEFSANPANADGDVVIQVVKAHGSTTGAKKAAGMYLSVLNEVSKDRKYGGTIRRLAVQPDREKATKWYFTEGKRWLSRTIHFMKVRDAPGVPEVKDYFLSTPTISKRDSTSKYLLVGPDWPTKVEFK